MKFNAPEIEVLKFAVEDVITTSFTLENPDNGGGWG